MKHHVGKKTTVETDLNWDDLILLNRYETPVGWLVDLQGKLSNFQGP